MQFKIFKTASKNEEKRLKYVRDQPINFINYIGCDKT